MAQNQLVSQTTNEERPNRQPPEKIRFGLSVWVPPPSQVGTPNVLTQGRSIPIPVWRSFSGCWPFGSH